MNPVTRCLQLDVGNSSAKWRLVVGNVVTARGKLIMADPRSREAFLECSDTLDHIWVSSVAAQESESALRSLLASRWRVEPWFAHTPERFGRLRNSYEDPSRMGVDRWLAMLAATERCDASACVVDAGSALTIDLIDSTGQHRGGYIIPGPQLMERALLLDTDRVRFAEQAEFVLAPGVSTASSVRHGIAVAQTGALSLVLDRVVDETPALFFCGGGGEALMALLDRGGEYVPDLVFEGLQRMAIAH
tara:strand:- start:5776 stop:6516 length:741 start_codon:yes stop_codon:yes gene_type:complete